MDVGRAGDYHGVQEVYLAAVLPPDSEKPLLSPVAVCCDDPLLRGLAARGLERMHARNVRFEQGKECTLKPGETGFVLTADRVIPLTAGDAWSREQVTLLLLSLQSEKRPLYDLPSVPRTAWQIGPLLPADAGNDCFAQRMLMEDGLAALFLLCAAMKDGPLDDRRRVPCRKPTSRPGKFPANCRIRGASWTPYAGGRRIPIRWRKGCASGISRAMPPLCPIPSGTLCG